MKNEGLAKHIDPSPQVDPKNFPELGTSALSKSKVLSNQGNEENLVKNKSECSDNEDNSEEDKILVSSKVVSSSSTPDIVEQNNKLQEEKKKIRQNINAKPTPKVIILVNILGI